jgi:hypothetical protein
MWTSLALPLDHLARQLIRRERRDDERARSAATAHVCDELEERAEEERQEDESEHLQHNRARRIAAFISATPGDVNTS